MPVQNYRNHRRFVPMFHFGTSLMLAVFLLGDIAYGVVAASRDKPLHLVAACLLFIGAAIFVSYYIFMRQFALRAQDRAIRAEENLRHFVLTGQLLDKRITMSQAIALRFAPDEELPELARKAAEKGLSGNDIKKEIRQWKADHYRV